MADNNETDNKGMRKFKFVEDFIDPRTGMRYPDVDSPKMQYPNNFHSFLGHQIAKIVYKEKRVVQYKTKIDKFGNTVKGDPEVIVTYDEEMGEKGGWIEKMENLSQGGECWVEQDGMVLDDAFIRDDAIVEKEGEVGDNAIVGGKARVEGKAGVGGSSYVYGNARIADGDRIAVSGRARVSGQVTENGIVFGDARVLEGGVVSGDASVSGFAQVYGMVSGAKVRVYGNAIVYGRVDGQRVIVDGNALIGKDGQVSGADIEVTDNAVVYGKVLDDSFVGGSSLIDQHGTVAESVSLGHAYVDGDLKDKSLVQDNAYLSKGSTVGNQSKVEGNGTVSPKGSMKDSVIRQNGRIGEKGGMARSNAQRNGFIQEGQLVDSGLLGNTTVFKTAKGITCSEDSGCIITGQAENSSFGGASLITENGSVKSGSVKGGTVVDGGVNGGKLDGSAVLGVSGALQGSMKDNSHAAVSVRGSLSGNGAAGVSTPQGATGNGVIMSAEIGASENQVALEPDDKRPGAAAVICKVEKE